MELVRIVRLKKNIKKKVSKALVQFSLFSIVKSKDTFQMCGVGRATFKNKRRRQIKLKGKLKVTFWCFSHFGASNFLVGLILCLFSLKYILPDLHCSKKNIHSFSVCITNFYTSCNLILCCYRTPTSLTPA